MRQKILVAAVMALLICFLTVPSIQAQGKCSLQMLAGTYAFYEKGSSMALDPNPLDWPPLHFAGVIAPFVNVVEITFTPYGEGDGFYWIKVGAMNGGLNPIPVHIRITEMNENCTGKMRYDVSLPNISSATMEERIIVMDNGREIRSIPISIEGNGIPTLAWLGYGHRISNPGTPVNSCGPQTASGTYVMSCDNFLVAPDNSLIIGDTNLFYMAVVHNGNYTGTLYEKAGPVPVETPVFGKFTVGENCSFTHTLSIPEYFPNDPPVDSRGVFFNQGKEFYMIPMTDGITGICQGKRVQ